jgi:hypothetical protein
MQADGDLREGVKCLIRLHAEHGIPFFRHCVDISNSLVCGLIAYNYPFKNSSITGTATGGF